MAVQTDNIRPYGLMLPIVSEAYEIAQAFSRQHSIPVKSEQVYLNTLAIWVVNNYLQLLGVKTNLDDSDSWSPFMQLTGNIADLNIEHLGKLECRPIRPAETSCTIPPETWDERVGYVVVEINDSTQQAHLLGFTPTINQETLDCQHLQPMENLLIHLNALHPVPQSTSLSEQSENTLKIHLSQWFNGVLETGWQSLEDIFSPDRYASLAYDFRSSGSLPEEMQSESSQHRLVRQAKELTLDSQVGPLTVILAVTLAYDSEQCMDITLQVYPSVDQPFLPHQLELMVRDSSGNQITEAQSRQFDTYIQVQISGEVGESFDAQIRLEDSLVIEPFIV